MQARGRPVGSKIRQNIVEILFFMGNAYGYQIFKAYNKIFSRCTSESIYYHLKKGVATGEFELSEIKNEEGDFSWGKTAEKSYYKLGKNAKPSMNSDVKERLEKEELIKN